MQPCIPHFSYHMEPLRELLKKNQVFYLDGNTNAAYQKLETLISKAHSIPLQYYQRDLLITVQTDANASKHG